MFARLSRLRRRFCDAKITHRIDETLQAEAIGSKKTLKYGSDAAKRASHKFDMHY